MYAHISKHIYIKVCGQNKLSISTNVLVVKGILLDYLEYNFPKEQSCKQYLQCRFLSEESLVHTVERIDFMPQMHIQTGEIDMIHIYDAHYVYPEVGNKNTVHAVNIYLGVVHSILYIHNYILHLPILKCECSGQKDI
jgi:hypothetical protein